MILLAKKGKSFWDSLYWARDKAQDQVIEVMRGCILALVETEAYPDLPYSVQISKAASHLHDAYYQGRKWQYDFDARLDILPGKRYRIHPETSKCNEHVFEFLAERHSPFRVVQDTNINLAPAVQCEVCTRDMAGGMFSVAENRIISAANKVYPPYYRFLKKCVAEGEAAI